jgi:hypothetical protein
MLSRLPGKRLNFYPQGWGTEKTWPFLLSNILEEVLGHKTKRHERPSNRKEGK